MLIRGSSCQHPITDNQNQAFKLCFAKNQPVIIVLADQNFYQKNGVELILGNPAMAKKVQNFYTMIDSSGICNFIIIGSPDAKVFIIMQSTG